MILSLGMEQGAKVKERILTKKIKNRDDLDQLYIVIRSCIAQGDEVTVDVWTTKENDYATESERVQET